MKVRATMNLVFERILFMVIGALIAGVAYFIGSLDYTAEAVDDIKTLECDLLRVSDAIIIGDLEGSHIALTASQGKKIVGIRMKSDENSNDASQISILAAEIPHKGAIVKMESKGFVEIEMEDEFSKRTLEP